MLTETFSTNDEPQADRAALFRDKMQSLFSVGLSVKPSDNAPLRTEMVAYSGRHLRFASFRFSPHETSATRMSGAGEPRLLISVHKRGSVTVAQDGRENRVEPDDIFLLDPSRPFRLETGDIHTHSIYLPASSARALTPHLDQLTARPMKGHDGAGAPLRAVVDELVRMRPSLDEAVADKVADSLPHLLAAALGSLAGGEDLSASRLKLMHLTRIRRYAREQLRDPGLDAERIGAFVDLSPRYIHQLFANEPQTLMRWIWSERLERCREELQAPALRGRTISEIAYSWGFSDVAHFSRSFRNRFGASPRDFRRAATAPLQPVES